MQYLPRAILLRAEKAKWSLPREALPPLPRGTDTRGLFLLEPGKSSFTHITKVRADFAPGLSKAVEHHIAVTRRQFALVPADVRTVYLSQGETFDTVVLDLLCPPPHGGTHFLVILLRDALASTHR